MNVDNALEYLSKRYSIEPNTKDEDGYEYLTLGPTVDILVGGYVSVSVCEATDLVQVHDDDPKEAIAKALQRLYDARLFYMRLSRGTEDDLLDYLYVFKTFAVSTSHDRVVIEVADSKQEIYVMCDNLSQAIDEAVKIAKERLVVVSEAIRLLEVDNTTKWLRLIKV